MDDVKRRLQDAFADSSSECVSCGQTLVKEGGHPLTWSADRVRSELGYTHPVQVHTCVSECVCVCVWVCVGVCGCVAYAAPPDN